MEKQTHSRMGKRPKGQPPNPKTASLGYATAGSAQAFIKKASEKGRPVSIVINRCVKRVMNSGSKLSRQSLSRSALSLRNLNSGLNLDGSLSGNPPFGHEGFFRLRNGVKRTSDYTKDLVSVLADRAELEAHYARALSKLSARLLKSAKDNLTVDETNEGTVTNAWHFIAEDMEATASTHKSIASLLGEDVVKPLKMLSETHHKARKALENQISNKEKNLNEWRNSERKTRAKCRNSTKENERTQDMALDVKLGRGRPLSEKDLLKVEAKRRKSEETAKKSNLDYYASCLKAERARLEWETSIRRGCNILKDMERDKLLELKKKAQQYHNAMEEHRPKLVTASRRLAEPIARCDIDADLAVVENKMTNLSQFFGDQILPSFYSEDSSNAMNLERRKETLARLLKVIKSDIDRESKGKAGVENLAKAIEETPKFGGRDSRQDVVDKIKHMDSMLVYLEACRYKVLSSLLKVEGKMAPPHPVGNYIEYIHERTSSGITSSHGHTKAVLRIPSDCQLDLTAYSSILETPYDLGGWTDVVDLEYPMRGRADGDFSTSNGRFNAELSQRNDITSTADYETSMFSSQTISFLRGRGDGSRDEGENSSDDFEDDFSDDIAPTPTVKTEQPAKIDDDRDYYAQPRKINAAKKSQEKEEEEAPTAVDLEGKEKLGTCTAIYDFEATLFDEMTIHTGDRLEVYEKQEDGWWLGKSVENGSVGIFPATYVQESINLDAAL